MFLKLHPSNRSNIFLYANVIQFIYYPNIFKKKKKKLSCNYTYSVLHLNYETTKLYNNVYRQLKRR